MTANKKQDYFDKPDNWFDNSKIEDHFRCPALFMWKWIFKIETKLPNIHLIFGNAEHDPLALYNSFVMNNPSRGNKELEEAKRNALELMSNMLVNAPDHQTKNAIIGEKLFNLTLEKLKTEPLLQGKITGVELELSKQLCSDIFYFGKIDLRIKNNENDTVIVDYKTKGVLKKAYLNSLLLSRQVKGYLWLDNSNIQAIMILHSILKPEIVFNSYYQNDEELNRWRLETISICKNIHNNIKLVRHIDCSCVKMTLYELFPCAGVKCQDWGCEYMRLCEQNCHAEDAFIDDNLFEVGE